MPALALEQVEAEICTLAARIAAGTCRYLELVAEFDRRDGWWRWPGVRSMADWLAWRCALTPRVAREHVRVARSLAELPQIHAEFKEGRLTYSKVRALTRIATRESEAELLELARHATAAQLERMIRAARRVSAQEAADSHERAHCFWDWEPDGSLRLNALLPAEEGAALVEALEAARSELARRRWEEAREGEEAAETAWRGSAEPGSDVIDGGSAGESDAPRTYRRPASHECLAHIAEQALARGPGRCARGRRRLPPHRRPGDLLGERAQGRLRRRPRRRGARAQRRAAVGRQANAGAFQPRPALPAPSPPLSRGWLLDHAG